MKIGIDIRAIGRQRTGDETYTLGVLRGLFSAESSNEYFLYTDTKDEGELENIKKIIGVTPDNARIVSISPSSKFLWTFFLLPWQAKKDGLDVLHVQYIAPLLLSKKISLVTTVHDISFERYPQHIAKKDLFFLKRLIPLSLKKADGVIAVSDFTKKEIIDVYDTDSDKVVTIHNGLNKDFCSLNVSEEQKEEFKSKHNLSNPYVLYVGTLQPRKNIPFLIKSFVALKEKLKEDEHFADLELIIGGSKEGKNYDKRIDQEFDQIKDKDIKKSIRFTGFIKQDDLPLYFSLSEFYANTSLYEGFGLPLIEAMSCGVPVVCSDDSCYPEVALDAAVIYKSENEEDFCDSALKVLKDKDFRSVLIGKGSQRIQDFSWDKNAMQTLAFYAKINKNKK